MQKELTQKDYWSDIHKNKRGPFYPNPSKYRFHFELDRIFNKYIPRGTGNKLMEIGCGGSIWHPYFFKKFGYKVYGMDYSELGCKVARLNLERYGIKGKIFCENFLFNSSKDFYHSFDIIVSFGVVEHFSNPTEVIKIFSNYLKPGGELVTIVPNIPGLLGKIQKIVDKKVYETHKFFTLSELENYHELCGLDVIYSLYFDFLDLSMINMTRLSPISQKIIGRLITLVNFPILYILKILHLKLSNPKLSSYMVVIASK